jgi:rhodanese-related sulfurtransferase
MMVMVGVCLVAVGCSGGGMSWKFVKRDIPKKYPEVPHMTVESLAATNRAGLLLVDVREEKEYRVSHLKDAIYSQSAEAIAERMARTNYHAAVIYCSIGYRSADMVRELQKLGVTNAYNLEGSIFEWANDGHPVYDSNGVARVVHPYNRLWGRLLEKRLRGKGGGE